MALLEPNRLIKASVARNGAGGAAFNFDDLRRQCDELVENARRQAQQILAEAKGAAGELRAQARAEGIADGQNQGLAAAHQLIETRAGEIAAQKTQEQLRSALPAFQAAVRALELERDKWLQTWEMAAIKLSAAIAGKVLRQEISQQPEISMAIVRNALQLAMGEPHVKLHLNPRDLEHLHDCGKEAVSRLGIVGEATLLADEKIARGGCLIETHHGVIDARIETQIERIVSELMEGT
jgi:flagellar assembly protein FliH